MPKALKVLSIITIFLSSFFLIKGSAHATAYCGVDTGGGYSTYHYDKYTCYAAANSAAAACDKHANTDWTISCVTHSFNGSFSCGACVPNDETCSATYHDTNCAEHGSGCTAAYYSCNINHKKTKTSGINSLCSSYGSAPAGSYFYGECGKPKTCTPDTINCDGKCGKWDRGCNVKNKNCAGCASNSQTCDVTAKSQKDSGTDSGGYCVDKQPTCNPKSCSDLGAPGQNSDTGSAGDSCDDQNDQCSKIITCGGCKSGLKCTGKNANGVGGTCTKVKQADPTPTRSPRSTPTPTRKPNDPTDPPTPTDAPFINVKFLVFYDKYSNTSQKGTERSYTNCFPATDPSGGGASSGTVSISIDSGDSGVPTRTYSVTSTKKCAYTTMRRGDNSLSLILNDSQLPSGYRTTGYNYSVDGGATVTCLSGSTNKKCNKDDSSTPSLKVQNNIIVRFGVEKIVNPPPPTPKIKARVFIDDNGNGLYEPGEDGNSETCYSGNVSINGTTYTSTSDCNIIPIANTVAGQNFKLIAPIASNSFIATGYEYLDDSNTCNNGDKANNDSDGWCLHASNDTDSNENPLLKGNGKVNYGIQAAQQTNSISGSIFVDTNSPYGKKNSNDHIYYNDCPPAAACDPKYRTITAYPFKNGVLQSTPAGSSIGSGSGYSLTKLSPGKYRIEYFDPATGTSGPPSAPSQYNETYPAINGNPPPYIDVNIGSTECWIGSKNNQGRDPIKDASCNGSGDITGLNFGITNAAKPWFQTQGGDLRIDDNLSDPIPSTAGLYASGSSGNMDPGILFTGQPSAQLTSSGSQNSKASSNGWLVTSTFFNPVSAGTRASYEYLLAALTRGGITASALFPSSGSPCVSNSKPNCALKAGGPGTNFPSGVYQANSNLILNGNYTFAPNTNYVILVNDKDNLNNATMEIQGNIIVPKTSTVVFAVNGKIVVDPGVTEIDGIYSSDGSFSTGTDNVALNVQGTVIANANFENKVIPLEDIFDNQRSLVNNSTTPSVVFALRPDFILNYPETLKVPNYVIQEVAPGPTYRFGASGTTPTPTFTPTPTPLSTPTFTPTPTSANVPGYRESGGKVVIEAEHYSSKYTGSNSHTWNISSANGAGANPGSTNNSIISSPDTGATPAGPGVHCTGGNATQVDYPVYFQTTGTYYVYLRVYGNPPSSFVGVALDCNQKNTENWGNASSGWTWVDQNNNLAVVTFTITQADIDAGIHYLNIWEREDGSQIDRIVLKQTSGTPSGTPPGGTESPIN